MKVNVGKIDMLLRLIAAAVLFYIGFMDNDIVSEGLSKEIIGFFGFLPLLTGFSRFCPLYAIIGISTCSKSSKNES